MIKYCDDPTEKESLEDALSKIQEVVQKLNEAKRIAENRAKIHEIAAKFSEKVFFFSFLI